MRGARASLAAIALVAMCAGVAPPSAAPSASPSPAPRSSGASKPALETPYYRVETDEIHHKGNGDFSMPNKVLFSRPGSEGTADHAEGNDKRGTVTLIGNVVVHDNGNAPEANTDDEYAKGGPSTLTCDRLEIDSKAKIYTAIGHVHFEQGARGRSGACPAGSQHRQAAPGRPRQDLGGRLDAARRQPRLQHEHEARRGRGQTDHHQAARPHARARQRNAVTQAQKAPLAVLT